jgi:hypothetical protein
MKVSLRSYYLILFLLSLAPAMRGAAAKKAAAVAQAALIKEAEKSFEAWRKHFGPELDIDENSRPSLPYFLNPASPGKKTSLLTWILFFVFGNAQARKMHGAVSKKLATPDTMTFPLIPVTLAQKQRLVAVYRMAFGKLKQEIAGASLQGLLGTDYPPHIQTHIKAYSILMAFVLVFFVKSAEEIEREARKIETMIVKIGEEADARALRVQAAGRVDRQVRFAAPAVAGLGARPVENPYGPKMKLAEERRLAEHKRQRLAHREQVRQQAVAHRVELNRQQIVNAYVKEFEIVFRTATQQLSKIAAAADEMNRFDRNMKELRERFLIAIRHFFGDKSPRGPGKQTLALFNDVWRNRITPMMKAFVATHRQLLQNIENAGLLAREYQAGAGR